MNFNPEQHQVISDLEHNLIVLASAGTGKTDTISARIVNILTTKQAMPSEILCLTFTNKACKEIKERIATVVGEQAKGITIQTIHSWCLNIIKHETKNNTDIFSDFLVYDEDDCNQIIEWALTTLNLNKLLILSKGHLRTLLWQIKEHKALLICDGHKTVNIQQIIDNIFTMPSNILRTLCTVKQSKYSKPQFQEDLFQLLYKNVESLLNIYTNELKSNHGLDFMDLILYAAQLFNNPIVLDTYKNQYKFIHIDEVQDVSKLEYSVIKQIFYTNKVLLCGDIFQTIYEWRGSEPNIILENFLQEYHAIKVIFYTNYRATKNLVNLSVGYLQNAFSNTLLNIDISKIKLKSDEQGTLTYYKQFNCIAHEAQYIFNQIKDNNLYDKTCILTRNNMYNQELCQAISTFQKQGDKFNFILVDQFKFFRRVEIKDVLAFMKLIINRHDNISLKRILQNFNTGVSENTITVIDSKEYRRAGITLADFVHSNTANSSEPFKLLIDGLKNKNIVVFDVETTGTDTTEDEIIQIAAIKIDDTGQIVGTPFERLLKTTKSLGKSVEVHKISQKLLDEMGEDRIEVLLEFSEYIKGSVVVGHNVIFDLNILTSELARLNLAPLNIKTYYDTLDIYRRFYPNTINHKLETLSKVFKTIHTPTHDAMDDILATAELLIMVINNKIIPTSDERQHKISIYIDEFTQIRALLNILFTEASVMSPSKILSTIVINFIKKENTFADKRNNLINFYRIVEALENTGKNNRDALIEILQISSLSNGDMELLLLKIKNISLIPIITVHQAKGLEFNNIFIAGMQEGTFPSYTAIKNNSLEEEKRIFYVALTRPKKRLFITCNTASKYNKTILPSNLLSMLPTEYIQK
ncbi:MAG: hypothetical protein BEN19_04380 [Epulopiscium sp. Nuni2H_MBin003]|nr:MAG: hypothetical protein BEN19_04380 [Epulopiscium sp. Nuni2H_MBin003]